jgi:hypothetical protein
MSLFGALNRTFQPLFLLQFRYNNLGNLDLFRLVFLIQVFLKFVHQPVGGATHIADLQQLLLRLIDHAIAAVGFVAHVDEHIHIDVLVPELVLDTALAYVTLID